MERNERIARWLVRLAKSLVADAGRDVFIEYRDEVTRTRAICVFKQDGRTLDSDDLPEIEREVKEEFNNVTARWNYAGAPSLDVSFYHDEFMDETTEETAIKNFEEYITGKGWNIRTDGALMY